jgi:cellulose synthase/poly-beta-1,6-N-acetylglucosamine synthase-like glycosyltransferase
LNAAARPANPTLTVTVLIPAHNEETVIAATVRAALGQTHPPERVLVIDDSSTDRTARAARAAGAEVLTVRHRSKSKTLNAGLATVTTDVVCGVDADTLLDADALRLLVTDLEAGHDATCATVIPQQSRGFIVRARRFQYALARYWWKYVQRQLGRIYVLAGCSYTIRTAVLRAVGGYVEAPISEDGHLTWRLYEHDARITYTPDALARTQEPETWRAWHRQQKRWASGFFQILAGHTREFRKPRCLLVVGSMLYDLVSMPFTYALTATLAARGTVHWAWILGWLTAYNTVTLLVAARMLGLRQALLSFVPHKVVAVATSWMYVWCGLREWVLGKHLTSWTGRQGRPAAMTRVPASRWFGAAALLTVAGVYLAGFALPAALSGTAVPAIRPPAAAPSTPPAAQPAPSGHVVWPPAEQVVVAHLNQPHQPARATPPPRPTVSRHRPVKATPTTAAPTPSDTATPAPPAVPPPDEGAESVAPEAGPE